MTDEDETEGDEFDPQTADGAKILSDQLLRSTHEALLGFLDVSTDQQTDQFCVRYATLAAITQSQACALQTELLRQMTELLRDFLQAPKQ